MKKTEKFVRNYLITSLDLFIKSEDFNSISEFAIYRAYQELNCLQDNANKFKYTSTRISEDEVYMTVILSTNPLKEKQNEECK